MELDGLPEISSPLPWQGQNWAQLNRQLDNELLPHALLLTGGQYIGKSRFALALARLLLCRQPSGGLNCGHCHSCQLSASGSHGDFRWLKPEGKSRVIKIDQVREVVEFTGKTASFGGRKVVVLAPADSMNLSASNALLKSLEEPAAGTYLVLVCHGLQNVPATIRSRCQLLRLDLPDKEQSLMWLDQLTGERELSSKLLAVSGERPILAEQLYLDGSVDDLLRRRAAMQALLDAGVSVPQAASQFSEVELNEFLTQLVSELQQRLRILSTEQLRTKAVRGAFLLLDEVVQLQRAVNAGANPNKQLMVEVLLSKLQRELGDGQLGGNIQA